MFNYESVKACVTRLLDEINHIDQLIDVCQYGSDDEKRLLAERKGLVQCWNEARAVMNGLKPVA